jgi:hypothetical protein
MILGAAIFGGITLLVGGGVGYKCMYVPYVKQSESIILPGNDGYLKVFTTDNDEINNLHQEINETQTDTWNTVGGYVELDDKPRSLAERQKPAQKRDSIDSHDEKIDLSKFMEKESNDKITQRVVVEEPFGEAWLARRKREQEHPENTNGVIPEYNRREVRI